MTHKHKLDIVPYQNVRQIVYKFLEASLQKFLGKADLDSLCNGHKYSQIDKDDS